MNLMKEIVEANERAQQVNPRYLTQYGGYGGKGAEEVWNQMTPEVRAKWLEHNCPPALLTYPRGLVIWARRQKKDIRNI